jgi:monoamine oxidase
MMLNCISNAYKDLDKDRPRKNITILGAGTAGLAAAYELETLGHTVRILKLVTE